MSTQLKLRRGTTAQHSTFTGASGEVTVDTDKKAIVVHDGATAGGFPQVSNQPTTRPSIRPSLLLDFANTKQLDPRVTFSRASTGAYYDGKTVVKAEENLLTYSQDFSNSAWSKQSSSIVTNSTTAPDGTNTATTLSDSTATNTWFSLFTNGISVSSATTASVYLKTNTAQYAFIALFDGITYNTVVVDLIGGTVTSTSGTSSTTSITFVGNGWYRVAVTKTISATTYVHVGISNSAAPTFNVGRPVYSGASSLSLYVWGAQLEQRSTATAYTPTTTAPITNYIPAMQTAAANVARFDHDPVTGESKGLLIEEQRANLLTASQDFDAPLWTRANVNIHANCAIAPDGTFTADRMLDTSITNGFTISRGVSVSASTAYSFSIYAKASGRPDILLELYGFGGGSAWFNLQTGVVTSLGSTYSGSSNLSASIQSSGNGWYRCTLTLTTASSGSQLYPQVRLLNNAGSSTYTGDGVSGIYIWGAQFEAGSFATSYIPTPLTYSGRASTATYKAADGLIRTAQPNVARYEPNAAGGSNLLLEGAASNLLTYTEGFDQWSLNNGTVAANAAVAPDGSLTAEYFTENTNTAYHQVFKSFTSNPSTTYTFSFYVKQAGRSLIATSFIGSAITGTQVYCFFNLANGTVGNNYGVTNPSITDVGGGWFRCQGSITTISTSGTSAVYLTTSQSDNVTYYAGTSSIGYYVWGAQVETGSSPTSYIPSVETHTGRSATVASYYDSTGIIRYAGSGVPRYTYNPSNLNAAPKLLLEPAATNLLTYSEQFDNAVWNKVRSTIVSNATVSPDGTSTADKIIEDTSATITHIIQLQGSASSFSAGTVYTISVFLKKAERSNFYIGFGSDNGVFSDQTAYFDLDTGTVTTYASPLATSIVSVGNGWFRCSVTAQALASSTNGVIRGMTATKTTSSYTGDGTSGLYIWGAQLETGYAPTSYIPTTTAQVTRAADTSTSAAGSRAADVYSSSQVTRSADSASMTGTNFSSWFRADEGTLYAEAGTPSNYAAGFQTFFALSDNTINNSFAAATNASADVINIEARTSGQAVAGFYPSYTSGMTKLSFAYKVNDINYAKDGYIGATDSSAQIPLITQINLGTSYAVQNILNGHIKRIAYYPKRLSNAELVGITS